VPGSTGHLVEWTENPETGPVYLYPPVERPGCGDVMALLGMATPDALALVAGDRAAGLRSALAAGKIVVFDDCLVDARSTARTMPTTTRVVVLPAHLAAPVPTYNRLPSAFIDPAAARARGWVSYVDTAVVTVPAGTGEDTLAAASAAADGVLDTGELSTPDHRDLVLLVATLVTLAGVVVTLALSAAEGRTDLAVLAVLGAQPWRRRTLAGAHALLIGGTGTVLGVLFGSCVAVAAINAVPRIDPVVPWGHLLLTVLAVPVLAVVVAVLGTRARLPESGRRE
jgi:putative ABC transport system permease protein